MFATHLAVTRSKIVRQAGQGFKMCEYLGYIWYILPRALSGAMPSDNLVRSVVLQNMPQLRPKKKLLDFSDIFFFKK